MAYADIGQSGKATVMTFGSKAWSTVGSAGFSATMAGQIKIAVVDSTTDALYIAYQLPPGNTNKKVAVMTFKGGTWSIVGSTGFSAGRADDVSLALNPITGAPYVAYTDWGNSMKATVMAFQGGAWSPLGPSGFSDGSAFRTSLALHPINGAPYVAYSDGATSSYVTVMTYDDHTWSPVGSPGFSAAGAQYISLALHATTGTPFVAYTDYGNSQLTVMKFA